MSDNTNIDDDEVMKASMKIIMRSGDARMLVTEALTAISGQDFPQAQKKLEEAQDKIAIAHQIQTDMIQGEYDGNSMEYSLIFAHAQDTMMTINSELNIAKQLFKVFSSLEKRLQKLENGD